MDGATVARALGPLRDDPERGESRGELKGRAAPPTRPRPEGGGRHGRLAGKPSVGNPPGGEHTPGVDRQHHAGGWPDGPASLAREQHSAHATSCAFREPPEAPCLAQVVPPSTTPSDPLLPPPLSLSPPLPIPLSFPPSPSFPSLTLLSLLLPSLSSPPFSPLPSSPSPPLPPLPLLQERRIEGRRAARSPAPATCVSRRTPRRPQCPAKDRVSAINRPPCWGGP